MNTGIPVTWTDHQHVVPKRHRDRNSFCWNDLALTTSGWRSTEGLADLHGFLPFMHETCRLVLCLIPGLLQLGLIVNSGCVSSSER